MRLSFLGCKHPLQHVHLDETCAQHVKNLIECLSCPSGLLGGFSGRRSSASGAVHPGQGPPSRSPSIGGAAKSGASFSASLSGALGRVLGRTSLGGAAGAASMGGTAGADAQAEDTELWFTCMDDFKPVVHTLHHGKYCETCFVCCNATGQHFLLKKYNKREWPPSVPCSA